MKLTSFVAVLLLTTVPTASEASFNLWLGGSPQTGSGGLLNPGALHLKFDDVSAGVVDLTLTGDGSNWSKLTDLYFNSTHAIASFIWQSGNQVSSVFDGGSYAANSKNFAGVNTNPDFDVKLSFSSNPPVFSSTSTAVIRLTGTTNSLNEDSFNDPVVLNGNTLIYAGMHVNKTPTDSGKYVGGTTEPPSTSTAVPEPASLVLWSVPLCLGLVTFRRRKSGVELTA